VRCPVKRYTENQVAHFIVFIQSPHITTDLPFGKRKLKLSNGEIVTIPDVIRNIIPSRIVSQYLAYCQETINEIDFKPLNSSSLFSILQKCSASTRKSLAGLDNFSSDGATAFDQLRQLCDEMNTFGKQYLLISDVCIVNNFFRCFCFSGVPPENIFFLKQALQDGRNFLKLDFKTHISTTSRVADHCSTFGLSDATRLSWRNKCDHEHDDECVVSKIFQLHTSGVF
jgi:hypothetical protein